ncbi:MAG: long-chain fatty acid--CoA ligase [Candidatus Staskawiczbacteria bacterium]|nr:long-chain fatty acid--CoA ligase [Candidatus Staskawiczbacteria bacterium]
MSSSIPEAFFEIAKKFSDRTALSYKKEGVYFPITYKELAKKVENFAGCLSALGVNRGDKVAILSENRPEWVICDLSTMALGAVVVPLHTSFNPKALCDILDHSQAKVLIVSTSDFLNKILLDRKRLRRLKKIIFLGSLTASQKNALKNGVVSWKALLSQNQNNKFEKVSLNASDCCSIIYTSGTTGKPKGVVLSHKNFLSNVESVGKAVPVKESDVFLSFLPLSHVFERMAGYYMPLLNGASIAYAENMKQLSANLKEVRPTILVSVPRVFEKFHDAIWDKVNSGSKIQRKIFKWALRRQKNTFSYKVANFLVFRKIQGLLGGKLRLSVSGGASLNENIAKFFYKIGVLVLEGYGLTETSPVVAVNRENDFQFGTVGKIIPGVEVKISDSKEILIKGPNVSCGYFSAKPLAKQPESEPKMSFDQEGWLCTGDLGFIDKQGFLTVIGRAKEMIVTSGGKNVWPERVESLLNNDRFISQAIIIGNNRKFISALIVPDWQEVEIHFKKNNLPLQAHDKLAKSPLLLDIFQKRLDTKINPELHEFEQVKKFKLLPQEFSQEQEELTATLKFRRKTIENHYKKSIEAMYG